MWYNKLWDASFTSFTASIFSKGQQDIQHRQTLYCCIPYFIAI